MKKTYISPELELIRFAPVERLAADNDTIDNLFSTSNSGELGASDPNYDFGMPL